MERAPRYRRNLDILSVKEAKLSASEVNDVEVGRDDAGLRQSNLFTVCQRRRGVVIYREAKITVVLLFGRENKVVVAVAKRLKR